MRELLCGEEEVGIYLVWLIAHRSPQTNNRNCRENTGIRRESSEPRPVGG